MSKIKSFLLLSLITLLFFTAPAVSAEKKDLAVVPTPEAVVLYDFRNYVPVKPKLAPGEERRLLSRLFPKYLKGKQRCDESAEFTKSEEDVEAGQFRPEVESVARGAFTKAGLQESAYLIGMWECHVARFWTYRLVVLSENKIVFNQEAPADLIRKVTDLDGDGLQEMLLEGGGTGTGITETNARLVSLSQGRLQVLKDFHEVSVDSCAGGGPKDSILAAVITYQPKGAGVLPEFKAVPYEAKCPADGAKARFQATTKSLN